MEGPTGQMRTVLYKGIADGSTPDRTPSLWLLPHENRLSLRVTTNQSDDLGIPPLPASNILALIVCIHSGGKSDRDPGQGMDTYRVGL